ncbi:MAG: hypothetical protein GYA45_04830 [Pelolinea sp.]|nr:hypothetical protein [Pelolinea sp.]
MQELQHRINLGAARVNEKGEFEILAITAGEGNGWHFSASTLQKSVSLWDGAETFIDHHWFGHSVHDLAGVCHSPRWDEQAQGIKLDLKPFGPGAEVLREIGKQILASTEHPKPHVGFSADVVFTAQGKDVQEILRVFSVDLVVHPARGGEFIREIYQKMKGNSMSQSQEVENSKHDQLTLQQVEQPALDPAPVRERIQREQQAIDQLVRAQEKFEELEQEARKVGELRVQMCTQFLESALAASRLPVPAQERLRKQFSGRAFEPPELQAAIEDTRSLISELSGAAVVQGSRIHSMFDSGDKLQAAVDDLLGAPREKQSEKLEVRPLTGIRELYLMLTGDYNLHGGYFADRVQLATTVDFTGLVKNSLNKIVVNTWEQLGRAGYDWWSRITRVEHFNTLNTITGTLIGTVGDLPSVTEGAPYTELAIGDSPETADFVKYGGYIPLTLELIDRDESRKLSSYPRELAAAGLRKISSLVAAIFSVNVGVGPTLADTGALFNTTAVTSAGGHANLRTTALSASEWDAVQSAIYKQPMLVKNASGSYGAGPALAINPRFLLVPRNLQLAAMKILYPTLENAANIYSENMQRGQPGDVITVPEWSDPTNWAAVCDPMLAPAIFVGERFGLLPEIFIAGDDLSPAVFTNDEHRLKVRHFLAVWVNDFRPLHKNNVADA